MRTTPDRRYQDTQTHTHTNADGHGEPWPKEWMCSVRCVQYKCGVRSGWFRVKTIISDLQKICRAVRAVLHAENALHELQKHTTYSIDLCTHTRWFAKRKWQRISAVETCTWFLQRTDSCTAFSYYAVRLNKQFLCVFFSFFFGFA